MIATKSTWLKLFVYMLLLKKCHIGYDVNVTTINNRCISEASFTWRRHFLKTHHIRKHFQGKKRLHEALFKNIRIYTLEITVSVSQGYVVTANFIAAAKKVTVMQQ